MKKCGKCWNGFFEESGETFENTEEYAKQLESDNPIVKEIAKYALEMINKK